MASGLSIRSGTIFGNVAGTALTCQFRPSQADSAPPPGEYALQMPVDDPVYGPVAMMIPLGTPAAGGQGDASMIGIKTGAKAGFIGSSSKFLANPGADPGISNKKWNPVEVKFDQPIWEKSGGSMAKISAPSESGVMMKVCFKAGATEGKVASKFFGFKDAPPGTKTAFMKDRVVGSDKDQPLTMKYDKSPATSNPVFVLSARAIPGRHSLVVSYGLSDLLDALRRAGGAVITVY